MCRGTQRPRISPALVLRLDIESEVLDHVIGEQLPAHRLDALARLVLARPLDAHLDVLADSHVDDLAKAERGKTLLDRDPLGVVDHRLGSNNHPRNHGSFLGLGGNSCLPTRRWYAARYRKRVCVTTSSGRRGGSDSLSQPERVSQSRTNCLS